MAEYRVFQVILFRHSLSIFVEMDTNTGGGELFSFRGSPESPEHNLETIDRSPVHHPDFGGSKMLGWMKKDDVATAWEECYAIAREDVERDQVECWYLACADMLTERKFVVPKPWWLLPGDVVEEEVLVGNE